MKGGVRYLCWGFIGSLAHIGLQFGSGMAKAITFLTYSTIEADVFLLCNVVVADIPQTYSSNSVTVKKYGAQYQLFLINCRQRNVIRTRIECTKPLFIVTYLDSYSL